jgi:predicted nucleic acid-binding protein
MRSILIGQPTCTEVIAPRSHSRGQTITRPTDHGLCPVHDCPDHEDNLILDLAAEVGALLIVSNDTDLLSMSPWRGTPIIEPAAFAAKVDAMRRHARRRRK